MVFGLEKLGYLRKDQSRGKRESSRATNGLLLGTIFYKEIDLCNMSIIIIRIIRTENYIIYI